RRKRWRSADGATREVLLRRPARPGAFLFARKKMRDIKEMIGILMRIIGQGETSEREVLDLDFDAVGELADTLNEAKRRRTVTMLEQGWERASDQGFVWRRCTGAKGHS